MAFDPREVSPLLGNALQPAVRQIVTDALARGVGSTLPTNAQYLEEHAIGAGTIQRALGLLGDLNALHVTSHGHQGRSVDAVDVGLAWQAAGLPPVRLLLPTSGAVEFDVLEHALANGLTGLGIPHAVRHRRGGSGRLCALLSGEHDLAVVSVGVGSEASAECGHVHELTVRGQRPLTRTLEAGTYYAPGRLKVVRRTAALDTVPGRVAIDGQSPDHVALTLSEFPEEYGVDYVQTSFPRVPEAVLRGHVDAGIWHIEHTVIPLDLAGLTMVDLQRQATIDTWQRRSAALLVGWNGRPELAAVLSSLPLDTVAGVQLTAIREEAGAADGT